MTGPDHSHLLSSLATPLEQGLCARYQTTEESCALSPDVDYSSVSQPDIKDKTQVETFIPHPGKIFYFVLLHVHYFIISRFFFFTFLNADHTARTEIFSVMS